VSINWWFFWPFCLIGIHSRRPALVYKPPHDHFVLCCKACTAELPRYDAEAQKRIAACLDSAKPRGCTWPVCNCK